MRRLVARHGRVGRERDAVCGPQRDAGDGDARQTNIYASAYNRDPEFYQFSRSINAYAKVFKDKSDILVLDPTSEFFKYLANDS